MSTDDFDRATTEQLGELTRRTRDVGPRADFAARVMASVQQEASEPPASGPIGEGTWRVGWRVLPLAALAACAAFVLAVQSSSSYEDTLVTTYDETSMELSW